MPKMMFTKDEYTLLSNQLERMHRMSKETAPVMERITAAYKTGRTLSEKFVPTPLEQLPEEIILLLNRSELRGLERLATEAIELLNSKVIPGYMARIDGDPERADFFRGYIKRVEAMRDGLYGTVLKKAQELL